LAILQCWWRNFKIVPRVAPQGGERETGGGGGGRRRRRRRGRREKEKEVEGAHTEVQ
jgi:hypothetical protein